MEETRNADVLILGAGPAGLRAALDCAGWGLRTLVVERKREIGSPLQTSGATWIGEIQKLGIPPAFCHRVDVVRFFSPNEEARFRNSRAGIGVLDVKGMLQFLAAQAIRRGARLCAGTKVVRPIVSEQGVRGAVVQTPSGALREITALVTIDATGFASVTARHLFGFRGYRRYGMGVEYDLYAPRWPQQELVLVAGTKEAPAGYGWIFPWGSGRVRAGVGVTVPEAAGADLFACLRRLLEEDARFSGRFKGSGCLEVHKGLIPDEVFPEDPAADGLLIIGDAAGQASALAGEGIRFAMEMGCLAAEAAAAAVREQSSRKELLCRAHEKWNRRHGRSLRMALEINRRMSGLSDEQWDTAVRYMRRLTDRQFLKFLKTDFTLGLFASILARNPGLIRRKLVRTALRELRQRR
ncbi:MAG: NAD(P)/FAD-dependent oxidoreductase [bacterium]